LKKGLHWLNKLKTENSTMKHLLKLLIALTVFFSSFSSVLYAQNINEKIILASTNGNIDSLNVFLSRDSANINYKDSTGYSALDYAMERYQKPAFVRLVEFFSFENKKGLKNYSQNSKKDALCSQLILAVLKDDPKKVSGLLKKGVNPNLMHWSGYSALSLAVRWGSKEIIDLLIEKGAKVNFVNRNRYNTTPLMEATRDGNMAIAQLLIAKGAHVNTVDINNDSAINWATFFGHKNLVELLLKNGAKIDFVGSDSGDNALAIAKRMGHQEIVALLINYGK
jgi:ankyrin repeat protein